MPLPNIDAASGVLGFVSAIFAMIVAALVRLKVVSKQAHTDKTLAADKRLSIERDALMRQMGMQLDSAWGQIRALQEERVADRTYYEAKYEMMELDCQKRIDEYAAVTAELHDEVQCLRQEVRAQDPSAK
jgi:cystathionine beta-lyase family protein involved in aluminum resistance